MTRLALGSVATRARLCLVLVSAIIPSIVGYVASGAVGTGTSGRVVRFAFSQTELSKPLIDIPEPDHEPVPVVTCQWPDGKTSITISAARQVKCFPQGTRFPVPKGGSWDILDSPIGGALYPVENGHLSDDIRFVHASGSPGVISVGPVLMQFGDYSGGARPSVVVSSKSVWIYDYWTENGPEVLRISTLTGQVLQRTVMPAISRPTCSVNQYGFWMGQAGNSFYPRGVTLGVWYAPVGVAHGVLVRRTDDFVLGIITVGRSVEVAVAIPGYGGTQKEYLWRFTPIS
jgi:hypothetical protein